MSEQYQIYNQCEKYKGYFFRNENRKYIYCNYESIESKELPEISQKQRKYIRKRADSITNKG